MTAFLLVLATTAHRTLSVNMLWQLPTNCAEGVLTHCLRLVWLLGCISVSSFHRVLLGSYSWSARAHSTRTDTSRAAHSGVPLRSGLFGSMGDEALGRSLLPLSINSTPPSRRRPLLEWRIDSLQLHRLNPAVLGEYFTHPPTYLVQT